MIARRLLPGLAALLLATGAAATSPELETQHEVKAGETLGGIANRAGVSSEAIAKANGLKAPYVVKVGQKLAIPRAKAATKSSSKAQTSGGSLKTATSHVVQPGETLGGIAARAEVPRVLIAEANGLAPPYNVRVGQKLILPRTRRHTVKAGDTGFSIAMDTGVPWEQIAVANGMDAGDPVKLGQTLLIPTVLNPPPVAAPTASSAPSPAATPTARAEAKARFAWPLTGKVRRSFQTGSDRHDGIDIPAAKGAMVRAAAAGTVVFAGNEKEQFGKLVVVDHGNGWHTAYGFLSRVTVKQGAKVAAGERVGLVGDTGLAKGNELHFEVRKDGTPVDPLGQLPGAD